MFISITYNFVRIYDYVDSNIDVTLGKFREVNHEFRKKLHKLEALFWHKSMHGEMSKYIKATSY